HEIAKCHADNASNVRDMQLWLVAFHNTWETQDVIPETRHAQNFDSSEYGESRVMGCANPSDKQRGRSPRRGTPMFVCH
ncbi:hypothetical protein Bpfe_027171, partial [Biomphalaria pfeifferi]